MFLIKCFASVFSPDKVSKKEVAYFVENDLLMRKWCSNTESDADLNVVYQIVIPSVYCQHVLCLTHNPVLSGHLGITKLYNRINFFWPGLKRDVVEFCRTHYTC